DGDKLPDIIASSLDHVFIINAASGALEWAEPNGEMGAIAAVRVGDFDGSGRSDILIQECGCCGASVATTGYVYGFAGGFSSPKKLWTLPKAYCTGDGISLADVDGDGRQEIFDVGVQQISILDGASGNTIASTASLGDDTEYSYCLPHDVDGKPGEELVCI